MWEQSLRSPRGMSFLRPHIDSVDTFGPILSSLVSSYKLGWSTLETGITQHPLLCLRHPVSNSTSGRSMGSFGKPSQGNECEQSLRVLSLPESFLYRLWFVRSWGRTQLSRLPEHQLDEASSQWRHLTTSRENGGYHKLSARARFHILNNPTISVQQIPTPAYDHYSTVVLKPLPSEYAMRIRCLCHYHRDTGPHAFTAGSWHLDQHRWNSACYFAATAPVRAGST